MGSTSNIELENLASFFNIKPQLVAVLQKDNLKHSPHVHNGFYIINNQSSDEGSGTHWTALYLNKNTSFFYDSFGSPPSIEIIKFCRLYSKHLYHNNYIIQDLHSSNCGYYCIGFIVFMINNEYNYIEFIKAFSDNAKRNGLVLEGLMRLYLSSKKRIPKELNGFFSMR